MADMKKTMPFCGIVCVGKRLAVYQAGWVGVLLSSAVIWLRSSTNTSLG
jgi:hypothetical protein